MAVSLSIKNVPDHIVERLRTRAARNHRSLQGELMAILEHSVEADRATALRELYDRIQRLGIRTPAEAVDMIREDRDGR